MTRRGALIAPRKRVFLGCEGESEQGYGGFLNDWIRDNGKPFHIDVQNLNPAAGSPFVLLNNAIKKIDRSERQRVAYIYKAVLIDDDTVTSQNDRRELLALATKHSISIIWQSPCHEAFLLKHFEYRLNSQPATSALALNALKHVWPDYKKGRTALQLSNRIDIAGVKRVAGQNAEFAVLLTTIGLLP